MVAIENRAIRQLEGYHMKREHGKLYVVCENLDFTWSRDDVAAFRELWREGHAVPDIAKYFNRKEEEIALLVIDQSRKGFIKQRRGGLLGWI